MVLAEQHFAATEIAASQDGRGVVLRNDEHIAGRNPEIGTGVQYRYVGRRKRISEARCGVHDERFQPVPTERCDMVVQDGYPAARLRDVVADIENATHGVISRSALAFWNPAAGMFRSG